MLQYALTLFKNNNYNQKSSYTLKIDKFTETHQKWYRKTRSIFAKQMDIKFTLKSEDLSPWSKESCAFCAEALLFDIILC